MVWNVLEDVRSQMCALVSAHAGTYDKGLRFQAGG